MEKYKVALIIGHDIERQGASFIGNPYDTEYMYNKALSTRIENLSKYENFEIKTFHRYPGKTTSKSIRDVYKLADDWKTKCTIELHFNSCGSESVNGFEFLSSGSKLSTILALAFRQKFSESFWYRNDRGVKIVEEGSRGYISLVAGKSPAIITEPFFGSSKKDTEWAKLIGIDILGLVYINAIRSALKVIA